jgi:hypothetical protein
MTMAVNSWNNKPPSALSLQATKTFNMHPQAARAWHDLFAALGVKPLEEYDGGAHFHPVDIANMIEKIDGENGGMKLLVYATQLQALDRPALRTKIMDYWSGPGLAKVLYAVQEFGNRAMLRMALYCYARHLYGPSVTANGPYRELVDFARK